MATPSITHDAASPLSKSEVEQATVAAVAADPTTTPAAAATADECSTESLLAYYNDYADWYDCSDEGAEDTYICVDRVTASVLRALRMPPPIRTVSAQRSSGKDAAEPCPKPTALPLADIGSDATSPSTPLESPLASDDSPSVDPPALSPSASPAPPSPTSPRSPSVDTEGECGSESPRSIASSTSCSLSSLASALSASSLSQSSAASSSSSAAAVAPLKVLDLGVGTGLASRPLFANLSRPRFAVPRRSTPGEPPLAVPHGTSLPEIWGVDLSPGMLRVSGVLPFRRLLAADLNTDLRSESLYPHSPLNARHMPSGFFDVVVSVGTTEFVRDYASLFAMVGDFLRADGLFCATFPSNQTRTYPSMNHTSVDALQQLASKAGMRVREVQQYRGWSVSADEHVEYIQILAQKT